jgi:hypothetical protein
MSMPVIALAAFGMVAGQTSAFYWLKSARRTALSLGADINKQQTMDLVKKVIAESRASVPVTEMEHEAIKRLHSRLTLDYGAIADNMKASIWTAVAIFFGGIASFLGTLPS